MYTTFGAFGDANHACVLLMIIMNNYGAFGDAYYTICAIGDNNEQP